MKSLLFKPLLNQLIFPSLFPVVLSTKIQLVVSLNVPILKFSFIHGSELQLCASEAHSFEEQKQYKEEINMQTIAY